MRKVGNYPNVTKYIQLVEYLFIREMLLHFPAITVKMTTAVYSHVFVLEGNIGRINQLRWSAMGIILLSGIEGRKEGTAAYLLECCAVEN